MTPAESTSRPLTLSSTTSGMPPTRRATLGQPKNITPVGQSVRITFAAAVTVFSMSAALWAVEMKPASNCDGAR